MNLDGSVGSRAGNRHDQSLEAYARAVRAYQSVVLELQNAESLDLVILGPVLERAAAARGLVNRYRIEHQRTLQTGEDVRRERAN
jgi:hypothetical protein